MGRIPPAIVVDYLHKIKQAAVITRVSYSTLLCLVAWVVLRCVSFCLSCEHIAVLTCHCWGLSWLVHSSKLWVSAQTVVENVQLDWRGVMKCERCHYCSQSLSHVSASRYISVGERCCRRGWLRHHQPHGDSSDHHWVVLVDTNWQCDPQSALAADNDITTISLEQRVYCYWCMSQSLFATVVTQRSVWSDSAVMIHCDERDVNDDSCWCCYIPASLS